MSLEPVPIRVPLEKIAELQANVERVIRGKSEIVRFAIASMLARGHVLLEDVPGVGKTTLAHALARSISLDFQRIQFTSDLLPSDIVGVTIFNQEQQEFEFVSGPVFTNVLLADEINRATPKSQSALLEAMNEATVTIEKRRLALPDPFLVIATQNPTEHVGTYPLPESQLDRFLMKLTIGYPDFAHERELLQRGGAKEELDHLRPVISRAEFLELQRQVGTVHIKDALLDFIMAIVYATRNNPDIELGVSTRGTLTLSRAAQAFAMVNGRDYVIPEDIKQLAIPVLAHRVTMRDRRGSDPSMRDNFMRALIDSIDVPR